MSAEDQDNEMAETANGVWTRIVVIVASALATIAFVLVAFVANDYLARVTVIEGLVDGMSISVAECRIHTAEHNRQAEKHIDNIQRNINEIAELKRRVAEQRILITSLQGEINKAGIRLDAFQNPGGPAKRFTSDDGDRHNARISELEHQHHGILERIHALERCCDTVKRK